MKHKTTGTWLGQLVYIGLFPKSKSECLFPVLKCDNGIIYRIRSTDSEPMSYSSLLSSCFGKRVAITGHVDDLRGHWRLTCNIADVMPISDDSISVVSANPTDSK